VGRREYMNERYKKEKLKQNGKLETNCRNKQLGRTCPCGNRKGMDKCRVDEHIRSRSILFAREGMGQER